MKLIPVFKTHKSSYFASIVNDTEVSIIFELLGLLKFWVVAQFLDYFLHKGFVCGFGKPALLIQQSQDSWRTILMEKRERETPRNSVFF